MAKARPKTTSSSKANCIPATPFLNSLGPFNYASLSTLLVFWKTPVAAVKPYLKGTGLCPGVFDGEALVSLNFERYASVGANYFSPTTEVEFNIVVYPEQGIARVPVLSADSFLAGNDETKTYGHFRLNVPCNSAVAVQAGSQKYGEIKFLTNLNFNCANINAPGVTDWWVRVLDPAAPAAASTPYIFDLHANFQNSMPAWSQFSPIMAYANLVQPDPKTKKPVKYIVQSMRNVFGAFQRWSPGPDTVQLKMGTSTHPMTAQMNAIFAKASPIAILLFESPTAACSSHGQWMTPVLEAD